MLTIGVGEQHIRDERIAAGGGDTRRTRPPKLAAPLHTPPPKTNKKTAQHRATGTRVLHVLGTGAFLLQLAAALVTRRAVFAATGVVSAYACAWVGHFFVEVCVSCLWCVCVCVLSV